MLYRSLYYDYHIFNKYKTFWLLFYGPPSISVFFFFARYLNHKQGLIFSVVMVTTYFFHGFYFDMLVN